MKIAFLVVDGLHLRGGVKRICEYASHLTQRGHIVHILAPDKVLPEWLKTYEGKFILSDINSYRQFKADIAIATGGRGARRLGRMQRVRGKLYSVVMLESLNKPTEKHGKIIDRDFVLKDPYKQGWTYYANSSWMQQVVQEKFNQKCHLILAPSNEKMIPSLPTYKPEGKLLALAYGGTSQWKGGQRTAEAIEVARQTLPNLEMIHYSQKSKPRSEVMVKHWSSPPQELLPKIYSSADITIHSSRFEGFANVIAESMSCGTPVISYKTPGIEDLIIHNETGIIVDNFDINDMAKAIVDLLTNKELYNKIKINIARHMSQFTWEKTLNELERVLEESLKK